MWKQTFKFPIQLCCVDAHVSLSPPAGCQRNPATTRPGRASRCRKSTLRLVSTKRACWSPLMSCSPTSECRPLLTIISSSFCLKELNTIDLTACPLLLSLSLCRFKNVIFEISPSDAVGVFDVKAKLLGVHLETLQIEYQVISLSLHSKQASLILVLLWLNISLDFFCVCVLRIYSSCSMKVWQWWSSSTGPQSMSTCLFSCSTRSSMGNRFQEKIKKEKQTLSWKHQILFTGLIKA